MKVGQDEGWKTCHKEGDVKREWADDLKKNIMKIHGVTSNSNYL